jgi:hypothetical protein
MQWELLPQQAVASGMLSQLAAKNSFHWLIKVLTEAR